MPTKNHRSRVVTVMIGALVNHRTFVLEAFLAYEALICGLWVIWGPGRRLFQVFTGIPPEWGILAGLMLAVHGVMALVVLHQRNLRWCRTSTLVSFSLWAAVATSLVVSPPHWLLAVPLTAFQALGALWAYLRLTIKVYE